MVLTILKIIGIAILVILAIIILLLLIVLLSPIRYRVNVEYEEKANGKALLTYHPVFLKAEVSIVDNKVLYTVKALGGVIMTNTGAKLSWLGRKIMAGKDDKEDEKKSPEDEKEKSTISEIMESFKSEEDGERKLVTRSLKTVMDSPESIKEDGGGPTADKKADKTEVEMLPQVERIERRAQKTVTKSYFKMSPEEKEEYKKKKAEEKKEKAIKKAELKKQKQEAKLKKQEAKALKKKEREEKKALKEQKKKENEGKSLYQRACDKYNEIKKKAIKLNKKREKLLYVYHSEKFAKAKADVIKYLKKLVDCIKPKHISGYLHFGMEDPAITGYICGILSLMLPLYDSYMRVIPSFESKCLDANIKADGKVRLMPIVSILLKAYFNRNLMQVIRRINKIIEA